MKFRLPYNEYLGVDKWLRLLNKMYLEEDWLAAQLFTTIDKRGYLADEEVPRMRRHLHLLRVLETEIRMRHKARDYHGV